MRRLDRRVDVVVVVDELGVELVGLPFEEPVEAVEAALARPLVVGPGRGRVLHLAEVPLAEGEGRVPLVAEMVDVLAEALLHGPDPSAARCS